MDTSTDATTPARLRPELVCAAVLATAAALAFGRHIAPGMHRVVVELAGTAVTVAFMDRCRRDVIANTRHMMWAAQRGCRHDDEEEEGQ